MGYRNAMLAGLDEVKKRVDLARELTAKEAQPDLERIWSLLLETVSYTNGVMAEMLDSCGAPFRCDPDANEMFQKGLRFGLTKAHDLCVQAAAQGLGSPAVLQCARTIAEEKERIHVQARP